VVVVVVVVACKFSHSSVLWQFSVSGNVRYLAIYTSVVRVPPGL